MFIRRSQRCALAGQGRPSGCRKCADSGFRPFFGFSRFPFTNASYGFRFSHTTCQSFSGTLESTPRFSRADFHSQSRHDAIDDRHHKIHNSANTNTNTTDDYYHHEFPPAVSDKLTRVARLAQQMTELRPRIRQARQDNYKEIRTRFSQYHNSYIGAWVLLLRSIRAEMDTPYLPLLCSVLTTAAERNFPIPPEGFAELFAELRNLGTPAAAELAVSLLEAGIYPEPHRRGDPLQDVQSLVGSAGNFSLRCRLKLFVESIPAKTAEELSRVHSALAESLFSRPTQLEAGMRQLEACVAELSAEENTIPAVERLLNQVHKRALAALFAENAGDAACRVLQLALRHNVVPTISVLAEALGEFVRLGNAGGVVLVVQELIQRHKLKDVSAHLLRAALGYLGEAREAEVAMALLEAAKLPLDAETGSALVAAHCRAETSHITVWQVVDNVAQHGVSLPLSELDAVRAHLALPMNVPFFTQHAETRELLDAAVATGVAQQTLQLLVACLLEVCGEQRKANGVLSLYNYLEDKCGASRLGWLSSEAYVAVLHTLARGVSTKLLVRELYHRYNHVCAQKGWEFTLPSAVYREILLNSVRGPNIRPVYFYLYDMWARGADVNRATKTQLVAAVRRRSPRDAQQLQGLLARHAEAVEAAASRDEPLSSEELAELFAFHTVRYGWPVRMFPMDGDVLGVEPRKAREVRPGDMPDRYSPGADLQWVIILRTTFRKEPGWREAQSIHEFEPRSSDGLGEAQLEKIRELQAHHRLKNPRKMMRREE